MQTATEILDWKTRAFDAALDAAAERARMGLGSPTCVATQVVEAARMAAKALWPTNPTIETFTLPAGTICKRNGIPFALVEDTKISTHPGNIEMIREDFVPAVGGDRCAAASGPTASDRAALMGLTASEIEQTSPDRRDRSREVAVGARSRRSGVQAPEDRSLDSTKSDLSSSRECD